MTSRLHAAIALAHWYIGQAGLKLRNGHHDDALTALENADKFVSVIGKDVAPDLEPLPESLRKALEAHGVDPDLPSVKSAEAWSPPAAVDFNDETQQAETEALVDETLKRMGFERHFAFSDLDGLCATCGKSLDEHGFTDQGDPDGPFPICPVPADQDPSCEPGCVCGDVTLCGTADPDLLSVCPKCGALVEDLDGFGVLAHLAPDGCGYCSHFDVYGDECRVCGATVND